MGELSTRVRDRVVADMEVLLCVCVRALSRITEGMDMRQKNLVINCFVANLVDATADSGKRGAFYDYER